MDGFLRRLGFGLTLLAAAAAGAATVLLLVHERAAMPPWLPYGAAALVFVVLVAGVGATGFLARRVNRLRSDFDTLSVAMDQALRELVSHRERDALTLSEQTAQVARRVDALDREAPPRDGVPWPETQQEREPEPGTGNVVPYPFQKAAARKPSSPPPQAATDIARLVGQAIAARSVDVSLRPIISMARGAAAGFDVLAYFEADGDGIALPANAPDIPEADRAPFEALVLDMTLATASRRLGSVSRATPLYAPVTDAFLLDQAAVARLIEAARSHEAAANAIVLSVGAGPSVANESAVAALQGLAETGMRIAIEEPPHGSGATPPRNLRLSFIKAPAQRLLGDQAGGRDLRALASATGATLIAIDVDSDEDAIALIDSGINLMSGSRFSGARRLRPDDDAVIERFSRASVNNS